jgi:hypothetical protein
VVIVLALVFYFMLANLREELKVEIRDLRARLFHLEQRVADLLARRTTTSEPARTSRCCDWWPSAIPE